MIQGRLVIVSTCILLKSKSALKLVSKGLSAQKYKGNISKEIGEENGEVFPSCSNRENLLIRPFAEDVNTRRLFFLFFWNLDTVQWRIQRRGPWGPAPSYIWT